MSKTAKGYCKLAIGLAVIWAMMFRVCPAIIDAIPAYQAYAAEIDRLDIQTSALFYNDVEAAGEAELHIRNTLRFMPRDMETDR